MEHSPTSATGTGLGAHPVARDAAGGVGGVEEDRNGGQPMMRPARMTALVIAFTVLASASAPAAETEWVLWSGMETIGGPMWTKADTFASRSDCDRSSEQYATAWVSRMESRGREPIRFGTDVITRLDDSTLIVHFVCLLDAKDPRVR